MQEQAQQTDTRRRSKASTRDKERVCRSHATAHNAAAARATADEGDTPPGAGQDEDASSRPDAEVPRCHRVGSDDERVCRHGSGKEREFLENRGHHTAEMYAWAEKVAEAQRGTQQEMHLLEELQEQCAELKDSATKVKKEAKTRASPSSARRGRASSASQPKRHG